MKKGKKRDCKAFAKLVGQRQEWFISQGHPQWNNITDYYNEPYYLSVVDKLIYFFDKKVLVGGCLVFTEDKFWKDGELEVIYIHSFVTSLEAKGIGKNAFDMLKTFFKEKGYKYIRIDCMGSNDKLIDIYKNYGFTIAGWDSYDGGDKACLMEYTL